MPATPAVITEDIQIAAPPAPPLRARASADPRQEYIAGGENLGYGAMLRTLPRYVDDVTRDFGRDLYARMAWDPAVQSATRLLRQSAVAAPVTVTPAVDGEAVTPEHPAFAQADALATFARRNLERVTPALPSVLYELSEAITEGHRLAEQVYELAVLTPGAGPQLVLAALKTKAPATYALVWDPYGNQPGIVYAAPGEPLVTTNVILPPTRGPIPRFLPRAKYALYTHWPAFGDPRGRSIARAAYHAWLFKRQAWAEYLKYLATFASAMLAGTTAPGAQAGPDGTTPEAAMLAALESLRNGGVMVMPDGAALQAIQVQGEGRAFTAALDLCNHEITLAIVMATRATMEAEHGSRADSGTAQDVVELGVQALRTDLAGVVRADVVRPLLLLNYGPDALRFLPAVTLGTTERHDFATEATAVAALAGTDVIHRSMLPGIRSMLNLPAADEAAEAADYASQQALAEQIAAKPAAPPPGTPAQPPPTTAPPPTKENPA